MCGGVYDTELLPHGVLWNLVIEFREPRVVLIFIPVNWKTCRQKDTKVSNLICANMADSVLSSSVVIVNHKDEAGGVGQASCTRVANCIAFLCVNENTELCD